MKLAVIAQSIAGVTVVGGGGLFIAAPNWLGIYYDIDIYAMDNSTATVANAEDAVLINGGGEVEEKQDTNSDDGKKHQCKVSKQTNKSKCHVSTLKTNLEHTKKHINFTVPTRTLVEDDNSTEEPKTDKYYHIIVSEHLLWQLQKSETKNIEVSWTKDTTVKSITLKALFAYKQINWQVMPIDQTDLITHYYVGKVTKLLAPKAKSGSDSTDTKSEPEPTTTITKTNEEKYSCSFWQDSHEKCDIYKLELTDTKSLADITFLHNDDQKTKEIQDGNFYLMKMDKKQIGSIFIKTMTQDNQDKDNNKMQALHLMPTMVLKINGDDKLFFFDEQSLLAVDRGN